MAAAAAALVRRAGVQKWMASGVIIAAAVAALAPTPAAWVEQTYSRQWYVAGQRILTPVSGLVGFSLLDLLAIAGMLGLGFWWWRGLRRSGSEGRGRAVALARLALHTAALAAALYLVFLAMWGLNYRRVPLTAKLDYDAARISSAALVSLASESVDRLNALYEPAAAKPWPSLGELPARYGSAFAVVQRRLGAARPAVAGRPKATLLTAYFRRAGIDGMISPFSLEVLVNGAVLPFERPFLVAHEWSHLAGYANESEASFVGVLICLAGDAQSRYSAWLYLSQQLVRHLSQAERERVWAGLDGGRGKTCGRSRRASAKPCRWCGVARAASTTGTCAPTGSLRGLPATAWWSTCCWGPTGRPFGGSSRARSTPTALCSRPCRPGDMIAPRCGEDDVQAGDNGQGRRGQLAGGIGEVRVGGRCEDRGEGAHARASAGRPRHDCRGAVLPLRRVVRPIVTTASRAGW